MDIYYTIDINSWNQVIQDSIIICNNYFFGGGWGWSGGEAEGGGWNGGSRWRL